MRTTAKRWLQRVLRSSRLKRVVDVAVGGTLLLVSLPLQLAMAIGVRLDSPGPVLYRATRAGLGDSTITVLKFRTMQVDADTIGPAVSGVNDPRITRFGRLLRETRMDELPQLWNVVRGEMSLVGPRPEDPRFVALYTPRQRIALSVRPGITGRAQLTFRNERELLATPDPDATYVQDILPRKVAIDVDYALNHDVLSDLAILIRTIGAVLPRRSQGGRGGGSSRGA